MAKKKSKSSIQESLFDDLSGYTYNPPETKIVVKENLDAQFYDQIGLVDDNPKDFQNYIQSINKAERITTMEDNKLFPQLMRHYQMVYDHISTMNDIERMRNYLILQWVNDGVCQYSRVKLGVKIHNHKLVQRFMQGSHVYWAKPPRILLKTNEIIEATKQRLEILKHIVKLIESDKA